LLYSSFFIAQQPLVWSEAFKIPRNEAITGIVGSDKGGFYVVRQKEDNEYEVLLDRYSYGEMERQFSNTIVMPASGDDKHRFSALSHVKDGFILFTSLENTYNDTYECYATPLGSDGGKVLDPVLVHSIPTEMHRTGTFFDYRFSPDSSKFLVFFNSSFERKAKEKLYLRIYGIDFEMYWKKDLELPYEQDVIQIRDYLLDNQADVYMMSGWAPDKNQTNNKYQRPQEGRYVLFHYRWKENRLKEFDVSLKDKTIVSIKAVISNNGDISLAGFFSNDYLFSVAGTFLFTLDPLTDGVKTATMVPFPKDFLSQFLSERAVDKGMDLNDFYLDHFIITDSGEVVLAGEQFFISERVQQDPVTGRQEVEYIRNFNDIIVVKLHPDGKPIWYRRVAKRQTTSDTGNFSSYNAFTDKEDLVVFFNDDPENTTLLVSNPTATPKQYSRERNSVTASVRISSSGIATRKSISNNKETGTTLKPTLSSEAVNGPVILGFEDARSLKYALYKSTK